MAYSKTIVNAGLVLNAGHPGGYVTVPISLYAAGLTSISAGTMVLYDGVFQPPNLGGDLTNGSTIEIGGALTLTSRVATVAANIGIEAAVSLYGPRDTFINRGLLRATAAFSAPFGTFTQTSTFQSDGVFQNGGDLVNVAGATIEANGVGVYMTNFYGNSCIIDNSGVIAGTLFAGTFTVAGTPHVYVTYGNGVQLGAIDQYVNFIDLRDSLDNSGTILGDPGVVLHETSYLINSGTIIGIADQNKAFVGHAGNPGYSGVAIYGHKDAVVNTAGSTVTYYYSKSNITNSGVIQGAATDGSGIILQYGAVTNQVDGTISGYQSAIQFSRDGTVENSGLIDGGVTLLNGGVIRNNGTIEAAHGGAGVFLNYASLINYGTVGSNDGTAVAFGTAGGVVVVDNSSRFGGIVALTSPRDEIQLSDGITKTGTLTLGSEFIGAGDVSFAQAVSLTVEGAAPQLAAGQTITGFTPGDSIVLDSFAATGDSFVSGTGLELFSGSSTITLDIAGNFSTGDFVVTDPPINTTIALIQGAPCFASGTRILTAKGEIAVEALSAGDHVICHTGGTAPIVWIGRRRLDLRRHPRPETVQPIMIEADAICDGVPRRALLISPDHALYLDGSLIPAKALVNGFTIRRTRQRSVTYFHVELGTHAVIYAESCPVESYLETGNRGAFENGSACVTLHPDFAQMTRETTGCAPFAESGPVVEVVRRRLLARAAIETTLVPNLRIRVRRDGTAVIASRSAIPGEIGADPRDRRRLGVKIAALRDGDRDIPLDHPALTEGWHAPEPDGRWTDGNAVIPAALARSGSISVRLGATLDYPLAPTLPRPTDHLRVM